MPRPTTGHLFDDADAGRLLEAGWDWTLVAGGEQWTPPGGGHVYTTIASAVAEMEARERREANKRESDNGAQVS